MAWSEEGIGYTAFCSVCKLQKKLLGGTRKKRVFICLKCKEAPQNNSTTDLQPAPLEAP